MNWEEVRRLTMVLDLPGQYHSKSPNCFCYWCYFLFISFCSVSVTLWTEPLFVFFLIEEEKRKLCLNRVKPLKAPQPNLLDQSILFYLVKLAFRVRASVYDTPVVIIEPAVPSARLLRLGSKPILATCSACSAKILLGSSSPREKQQRRRWLRKRHLKSEFAPLQTWSPLSHLVQFVKCWWTFLELNSKGLCRRSRKETESRCLVFTSCQREIRHFHVIFMQKRQRNVQKKTWCT